MVFYLDRDPKKFKFKFTQHLLVSFVKGSGVFLGIVGRKSLFSTSIDTCNPLMSKIKESKYSYMGVHELQFPRG